MNQRTRKRISYLAVMLALGLTPAMLAQSEYFGESDLQQETEIENASEVHATDDHWTFEVAPFLWALSLDADLTVRGKSVLVDLGFSDIWDDLDIAGMGQLQASKDKWIFQVNGMYARLSMDGSIDAKRDFTKEIVIVGEIEKQLFFRDFIIDFERDISIGIPAEVKADISVEIEIAIVEFFAGYELFNIPLMDLSRNPFTQHQTTLKITPYGGARYTYFKTEVDLNLMASLGQLRASGFFEFDDSESWIDPVIGLDLALVDLGKWSFGVRSDIGGFGIDGASDLVWSLGGRVTYQVSPNFFIWGGYHMLDYDYSTGNGANEFALNGRFEGPILGGGFTF